MGSTSGRVLELVDKADLGSVGLMLVGVRLPPRPPISTLDHEVD